MSGHSVWVTGAGAMCNDCDWFYTPGCGHNAEANSHRAAFKHEQDTHCIFCAIIDGDAPAQMVAAWDDVIAFCPLDPCTEGHVLVVPRKHVKDALEDPEVTAATMKRAAELASTLKSGQCNLITSAGKEATQTVFHLHIHIVPRKEDDGLLLPWSTAEEIYEH